MLAAETDFSAEEVFGLLTQYADKKVIGMALICCAKGIFARGVLGPKNQSFEVIFNLRKLYIFTEVILKTPLKIH